MVVGLIKSIHQGVYNYTDGHKNKKKSSQLTSNNMPNNMPNNNSGGGSSTKSILIVIGIILAVLIVGLGPIFRSWYLSAVCNQGNMQRFLIEFSILFLISFLWVPNVVYCFWKSGNCIRRR